MTTKEFAKHRATHAVAVGLGTVALFGIGALLGTQGEKSEAESWFKAVGFGFGMVAFFGFILTFVFRAMRAPIAERAMETFVAMFALAGATHYALAELDGKHVGFIALVWLIGVVVTVAVAMGLDHWLEP